MQPTTQDLRNMLEQGNLSGVLQALVSFVAGHPDQGLRDAVTQLQSMARRHLSQADLKLITHEQETVGRSRLLRATLQLLQAIDNSSFSQEHLQQIFRENFEHGAAPIVMTPGPVPRSRPNVPFQAPLLPPKYVARENAIDFLKDRLLPSQAGEAPPHQAAILWGIAAVGKSVLATAFARDPEVAQVFPDGILWATLGQEADLLTKLSNWGRAFEDPSLLAQGTYPSLDAAVHSMRSLLHNRRCLLVIDDAWQQSDILPFLVGGPRSLALVTSRQNNILPGAEELPIDVMQEEEALQLMQNWAGEITEEDLPIAQHLAAELGYLPLALELVSAQIRSHKSWELLQEKWETQKLQFLQRRRRADKKQDSVAISLELSIQNLHEEDRLPFVQLAVFGQDRLFPLTAVATFLDDKIDDPRAFVQDLVDHALLTLFQAEERELYGFHDLLYDYLINKLGHEGLLEAHRQLVEQYRRRCGDQWEHLPPDGYIHEALSWHLREAELRDELYALIRKGWMDTQNQLTTSYASFGTDVRIAVDTAIDYGDMVPFVRNSLVFASLLSSATRVHHEALALLVRTGQSEKAFGYLVMLQDLSLRCRAGIRIYRQMVDSQVARPEIEDLLVYLYQHAMEIHDSVNRDQVLEEFAFRLIENDELDPAFEVMSAIEDVETYWQPIFNYWVERFIQAKLKEVGLDQGLDHLLEAIQIFEETLDRDQVLGVLVFALLEQDRPDEALSLTKELDEAEAQLLMQAHLARHLAQHLRVSEAVKLIKEVGEVAASHYDPLFQHELQGIIALTLAHAGQREMLSAVLADTHELVAGFGPAKALHFAKLAEGLLVHLEAAQLAPLEKEKHQLFSDLLDLLQDDEEEEGYLLSALKVVLKNDNKAQAEQIVHRFQVFIEDIVLTEVKSEREEMIALALSEAGELDWSLEIAQGIRNVHNRTNAFLPLLYAFVQSGEERRVETLLLQIDQTDYQAIAHLEIARALLDLGREEEGEERIRYALALSEGLPPSSAIVPAFTTIALMLENAGQQERAEQIVHRLAARAAAVEEEYDQMIARLRTIPGLFIIDDSERIDQLIEEAIDYARHIKTEKEQSVIWAIRAMRLTQKDNLDGSFVVAAADALLTELTSILAGIGRVRDIPRVLAELEDPQDQADAVIHALDPLLLLTDQDVVLEITGQLTNLLDRMDDENERLSSMMVLARFLINRRAYTEAYALVDHVEDSSHQVLLLRWMADGHLEDGGEEEALAALEQARLLLKGTDDPNSALRSLLIAGDIYLRLARERELADLLVEIRQLAGQVENDYDAIISLGQFGAFLLLADRPEEALQLSEEMKSRAEKMTGQSAAYARIEIAKLLAIQRNQKEAAIEQLQLVKTFEREEDDELYISILIAAIALSALLEEMEEALALLYKLEGAHSSLDNPPTLHALLSLPFQYLLDDGLIDAALALMIAWEDDAEGRVAMVSRMIADEMTQEDRFADALKLIASIRNREDYTKGIALANLLQEVPSEASDELVGLVYEGTNTILEGMGYGEARVRATCALIGFMRRVGLKTDEPVHFAEAMQLASWEDYELSLDVLQAYTPVLADEGHNEVLWQIYLAIEEVERWWREERSELL